MFVLGCKGRVENVQLERLNFWENELQVKRKARGSFR